MVTLSKIPYFLCTTYNYMQIPLYVCMLLKVGFRSRRLPALKAQIYSRFVNKLFSNVPRVIKKIYAFINSSNNISTGCLRVSAPQIFTAGSRLRLRNPGFNQNTISFLISFFPMFLNFPFSLLPFTFYFISSSCFLISLVKNNK